MFDTVSGQMLVIGKEWNKNHWIDHSNCVYKYKNENILQIMEQR